MKRKKDEEEPKKANKNRMALYLDNETMALLEELCEALHITSRSAVVSQAVARLHSREPLVKALQKRREASR